MPKTFSVAQEGSSKSLHLDINRDDSQVVVASSAVFRIYKIEDDCFEEGLNLRGAKSVNLNYSCNDVCWSKHDPSIIATAATNGKIVIWNLERPFRTKQEHVFDDHARTVNRVTFHPVESNYLLSGSQDGTMKLFDLRLHECAMSFTSGVLSVRDVAFSPHGDGHLFAAGSENGHIQLWDIRRPDRMEKKWPAHSDHIFAVDWHPESRYTLASAGRDKQIKIWNSQNANLEYLVHSIGPVGKIKWRPRYNYHLASCSGLVGDFSVNVWDVRRPYIPLAVFSEHKNVATDLKWLKDPDRLISGGKDNLLIHHSFGEGHQPAAKANPTGLAFSNLGRISHAFRDGSLTVSSPFSALSGFPEVVPAPRTPQQSISLVASSSASDFGSFTPRPPTSIALRADADFVEAKNISPSKPLSPLGKIGHYLGISSSNEDSSDFRPPPVPQQQQATETTDMFLACSSQLQEFFIGNEDANPWVDSKPFVRCARNYQLSGASLDALCEINARVAEAANRQQIAETWRMIRLLAKDAQSIMEDAFDDEPFFPGMPGRSSLPDGAVGGNVDDDSKFGRSRAATTESQRRGGASGGASGGSDNSKKRNGSDRRDSRGKTSSAESKMENGVSEAEEEEGDFAENELTLTNIASGQMLTGGICNDFFGDAEISADLVLENFVAVTTVDSNNGSNDQPLGWELRSEAFEPRVNLNMLSEVRDETDQSVDIASSNGAEGGGPSEVIAATSNATTDFHTVLVEDQTSSLLCIDSALQRTDWNTDGIIRDTLIQYAEIGDVQTAVSMYLVLRSTMGARMSNLIDEPTLEFWIMSYIELLQRFQLYNDAAMLIKQCPLVLINQLSHQSTSYLSNCTKCSKALSRPHGSWYCERCKRTPNLCILCKRIVRGLFAWCQGCSHGGHLKCLRKWYGDNTLCPTGCGHHCEYQ